MGNETFLRVFVMRNETFLLFQIRNGLGRFEMPKRNFLHSFDAFGKLSSWKFTGNGSAYFSTRYIATLWGTVWAALHASIRPIPLLTFGKSF